MTRPTHTGPISRRGPLGRLAAVAAVGVMASAPARAQETDRAAAWRQDIDVLLTDFLGGTRPSARRRKPNAARG